MKPSLCLCFSVVCNVALIATCGWFLSCSVPQPEEVEIEVVERETETGLPELAKDDAKPTVATVPEADVKQEPEREQALVERLVAAGWPQASAEAYAFGRDFQARILETLNFDGPGNYWETPFASESESRVMEARLRSLIDEELGLQMIRYLDVTKYPMAPEKVRRAARIVHDYNVRLQQVPVESVEIWLEEDSDATGMLREQFLRDIRSVLSPEELVEFNMRHSASAEFLQSKLQQVDPTEEEFRAIFRLQHEASLLALSEDPEGKRQYEEARESLDDKIEEILGPERHRQYVREGHHHYVSIVAIADELSLPRENANRAFDLREEVIRVSKEIRNSGHSPEEQREMDNLLKEETRAELKELLGEQGLELFKGRAQLWVE